MLNDLWLNANVIEWFKVGVNDEVMLANELVFFIDLVIVFKFGDYE